jgi:hypothetical protein
MPDASDLPPVNDLNSINNPRRRKAALDSDVFLVILGQHLTAFSLAACY